eukprot:13443300-Ditylum_brightwellii.AAC.1
MLVLIKIVVFFCIQHQATSNDFPANEPSGSGDIVFFVQLHHCSYNTKEVIRCDALIVFLFLLQDREGFIHLLFDNNPLSSNNIQEIILQLSKLEQES